MENIRITRKDVIVTAGAFGMMTCYNAGDVGNGFMLNVPKALVTPFLKEIRKSNWHF